MTLEEQETIIFLSHGAATAAIYTTNPADQFNPLGGVKSRRKPMTDEQRAAASERMALMRSKRGV